MAIDQIKINSTAYDIGASASNISFNKNGTSLDATNVQSAIVEIDGDVSTLGSNKVDKVNGKGLSTNDFTDADKTKLNGIETGAQVNTITGVKGSAEQDYRIGNVSISKTDIGLANVDNTSDVNKPISTATQNALNNKVDKVTGKGLSTEDYTTAEKDKLGTVSEYANHVNVTRYGTEGTKIATISCDGIDTDIYTSGNSDAVVVTIGVSDTTLSVANRELIVNSFIAGKPVFIKRISSAYGAVMFEVTECNYDGSTHSPQVIVATRNVHYSSPNRAGYVELRASTPGWAIIETEYVEKLSYTTSEQDTGKKWIDGKTIYQKTINSTSASGESLELATGVADLVSTSGYIFVNNNTATDISSAYMNSTDRVHVYLAIGDSSNTIYLNCYGSLRSKNFCITIRYTKATT